jgi:RNA polymerase sigma factor (sigma-70 family)
LSATQLVEHFFRHEYGRLVATLCRRFGTRHLDAVEDAVQSAMMSALETWSSAGPPDEPSAWLFRVAQNNLSGTLRQATRRNRILELQAPETPEFEGTQADILLAHEMQDDLLRMLFVCCDEAISESAQVVLSLKVLCGFSVREISQRLFISEANVYKRLTRAQGRLRETPPQSDGLNDAEMMSRVPAVRKILYVLFTEGHLSSGAEAAIRKELCNEAIRLTTVLAGHPIGQTPETFALLALMHLHSARMTSRQDGAGGLLLLEEQDRSAWDASEMQVGLDWLARSAQGDVFTRYHAEAGIAAEHCLAPSLQETRWDKVAEYYQLLERSAPSAIHRLNRAVAVAEWRGPAAALEVLNGFEPPAWLTESHLWPAVLADLHQRCGHTALAGQFRIRALELAPTSAVRRLLQRRFDRGPSDRCIAELTPELPHQQPDAETGLQRDRRNTQPPHLLHGEAGSM